VRRCDRSSFATDAVEATRRDLAALADLDDIETRRELEA
jgi:hypothetical protein